MKPTLLSNYALAHQFYPGRQPARPNRRKPLYLRLLRKLRRFFLFH